jgi:hypothetical protein
MLKQRRHGVSDPVKMLRVTEGRNLRGLPR